MYGKILCSDTANEAEDTTFLIKTSFQVLISSSPGSGTSLRYLSYISRQCDVHTNWHTLRTVEINNFVLGIDVVRRCISGKYLIENYTNIRNWLQNFLWLCSFFFQGFDCLMFCKQLFPMRTQVDDISLPLLCVEWTVRTGIVLISFTLFNFCKAKVSERRRMNVRDPLLDIWWQRKRFH